MTRQEHCSRKGRSSSWIRREKRLAIYIRDRFQCCYCGKDLRRAPARQVTLDHLDPRCNGGHNAPTNLITACLRCNSARQDRPWTRYATGGATERIRSRRYQKLNLPLAKAILAGKTPRGEAF
jgi:5-methylcytosine-specific restriction endonuclease McrA